MESTKGYNKYNALIDQISSPEGNTGIFNQPLAKKSKIEMVPTQGISYTRDSNGNKHFKFIKKLINFFI